MRTESQPRRRPRAALVSTTTQERRKPSGCQKSLGLSSGSVGNRGG